MPTVTSDGGLLFVLGETGPEVSEEEFNLWYDTDHAPARLKVPGFQSALRYKATDGLQPTWLAIYELDSPDIVYSDTYKSLSANAPDYERTLISKLSLLHRRIYKSIAVNTKSTTNPESDLPGKYILTVLVSVPEESEEELNAWYKEEHLQAAVDPPGCFRGQQYKLVDNAELTGKATSDAVDKYLAIYDWDRDTYSTDSPELAAAISTPRTKKLLESGMKIEARRFVLYKDVKEAA